MTEFYVIITGIGTLLAGGLGCIIKQLIEVRKCCGELRAMFAENATLRSEIEQRDRRIAKLERDLSNALVLRGKTGGPKEDQI